MRVGPALPRSVALAALAVAAGAQLLAQAPPRPPTFGVGVEVVTLTVSVVDARSRFVTELKERQFAVFEDGVRQELSLFTQENLPISLSILIDTSASMTEKLGVAQAAAVRFAKTLREQDSASVMQFNNKATVLQEFTADLARLEAAIKKTEAGGSTSLHNALYVSLKDLGKQKKAGELRRRAIVLLSDGEDTSSLVSDEQVLQLARETEIAIYSISLRPDRARDRSRLNFSQAAHVLTALAQESGGQVYFPNSLSELDTVYDRIAEELRTQYNLGYVSVNKRRDGKWRRIVVRVQEREDLVVRHRLGYYAPRG